MIEVDTDICALEKLEECLFVWFCAYLGWIVNHTETCSARPEVRAFDAFVSFTFPHEVLRK
jgi:hypothetical protein